MITKVCKRNGDTVDFNENKIYSAISYAYVDVYNNIVEKEDEIETITNNVVDTLNMFTDVIHVETIQDIVEQEISQYDFYVAKAYITYRYRRKLARDDYDSLMKEVAEKLGAKNVENQNANMDERSFGGRIGSMASAISKHYALKYIMSPMAKKNHEGNMVYEHDLDHYAVGDHNCLSCPVDELLAKGFNTRQCDVRPANSVSTALQLIAVIFQIQSLQQFGGVSATHLDWSLVPYVRKTFLKRYIYAYIKDNATKFSEMNIEEMTFDLYTEHGIVRDRFDEWIEDNKSDFFNKTNTVEEDYRIGNKSNLNEKYYNSALLDTIIELKQGIEGLYHNLNTLQSRSGNQLPFSSINYGTCTIPEGRLVIKTLLQASISGVGKLHRTSIFPCGIFQYMKGVNDKGSPNYDLFQLAIKSTAKRLYPNYANVDWSGNVGYDRNDPKTYFSTMGCRTANGYDINADEGVNPQTKDGRGNICPVTVIMPTLAMMAKGEVYNKDIDSFFEILDTKIHEAKDMLIERFEYICSQSSDSAKFMYENGTMIGYDGKNIRSALKHGTLALGQLGLAETLQILIGCDHTTEKGMELAKKIEQLFKDRCSEFKQKYKLNFGVYYTPAENLCFTAMTKFKAQYGIIPKVSENKFFTNSIHVPVWYKCTMKEKIDIESQLTGYSSAGCITYIENDGYAFDNPQALEKIVTYAMNKDIPYFAINVPNDTCNNCGFTGSIDERCPICDSDDIARLRRVTGYLTGDYKTAFNEGKQQEVEMRTPHSDESEGVNNA